MRFFTAEYSAAQPTQTVSYTPQPAARDVPNATLRCWPPDGCDSLAAARS